MTSSRVLASWLGLALWLFACESPIVGLECRPEFTLCDGTCVDLRSDFRNCGQCDNSCGHFVCMKGTCSSEEIRDSGSGDGGRPDGGSSPDDAGMDGGVRDGGPTDAGPRDAGPPDDDAGGFDPDANLPGCTVGYLDCGGECVNPATDTQHCGACNNVCGGDDLCSAGSCVPECEETLSQCGSSCIDVQRNADHCGRCGTRCNSGICETGSCADRIAGQAVVIGHDFSNANTAMQRLLGNAVFLGLGAPVRVLVYAGDSSPVSRSGVERAIDVVKAETGRAWQRTDAVESLVPLQLSAADVFLIHAQVEASNSTLMKLSTQWASALNRFVSIGGVVVVVDAPSTPSTLNNGTFQVLEEAGIFTAESREAIESQALTVQTPGLGVAVRVPERYMGLSHTVRFNGVDRARLRGSTFVVTDRNGVPVVVQRVISVP
jgi:hypothetical protein